MDSIYRFTDFLTNRRQYVRLGPHLSQPRTVNIGAHQGCVLSPLLFSLYTNDFSGDPSVKTIKYADDTTIKGLISNNESAYRREVGHLEAWGLIYEHCDRNLICAFAQPPIADDVFPHFAWYLSNQILVGQSAPVSVN